MRIGGEDGGGMEPSQNPQLENYQLLFTIFSILYLFLGVCMLICAWVTPQINLGASVTFTLMSVILVIAAIVQIVYRKEVIAYLCGPCSPTPMPA